MPDGGLAGQVAHDVLQAMVFRGIYAGTGVGSAAAAGSAATSTTGGFRKLVAQAAAMAIARGPPAANRSYPKLTVERASRTLSLR